MIIETERTILRPIEANDNKQVFSYRSDFETNKYQGWIPSTLDDVDVFISKNPSKINIPDTWFQLVIINKITDEIIGDIGVHFIDNTECEIGCTLGIANHGSGFASEALGATIDFLFNTLNKNKITASIDPLNKGSISLVHRLGFVKKKYIKKSYLSRGTWVDDIIYSVEKTDYKGSTKQ